MIDELGDWIVRQGYQGSNKAIKYQCSRCKNRMAFFVWSWNSEIERIKANYWAIKGCPVCEQEAIDHEGGF